MNEGFTGQLGIVSDPVVPFQDASSLMAGAKMHRIGADPHYALSA